MQLYSLNNRIRTFITHFYFFLFFEIVTIEQFNLIMCLNIINIYLINFQMYLIV